MPGRSSTARALHLRRRRDDHDGVDPPVASGFEQQWNIEHSHVLPALFRLREEARSSSCTSG